MTADAAALLAEAQEALAAGEWVAAKASFEQVLEHEESAEALFGLGNTLWWLGETGASIHQLERAYSDFRRRPDPTQAALAAVHLCLTYGQPRQPRRLAGMAGTGGTAGRGARPRLATRLGVALPGSRGQRRQ